MCDIKPHNRDTKICLYCVDFRHHCGHNWNICNIRYVRHITAHVRHNFFSITEYHTFVTYNIVKLRSQEGHTIGAQNSTIETLLYVWIVHVNDAIVKHVRLIKYLTCAT
jgi:hypothetical protein